MLLSTTAVLAGGVALLTRRIDLAAEALYVEGFADMQRALSLQTRIGHARGRVNAIDEGGRCAGTIVCGVDGESRDDGADRRGGVGQVAAGSTGDASGDG